MSTLRSRLLRHSLLIAVPSVVAIAVIGVVVSLGQVYSGLTERLMAGARGAELALATIHDGIRARTVAGARSPSLQESTASGNRLSVLEFAERTVDIVGADRVTVVGADGRVLARGHAPTDYGDSVLEGSELGRKLESDTVGAGPGPSGLSLRVSAPIRSSSNKVLGVLLVEKTIDYALLRGLKRQFGLDFTLWDGDRLQATTLASTVDLEEARAAHQKLASDALYVGKNSHFTSARLSAAGTAPAALLVAVRVEAAQAFGHRLMLLNLIVTLGMVALGVSGAVLSARGIVKPIRALVRAAEAASDGRPDVSLEAQGIAELDELSSRFRSMLERRRKIEEELRETQADLEARVVARTEALRQSEEHLRHARQLESLGRLAGGIAHDFNNILTVILGNSAFVVRELETLGIDGEARTAIGEVRTSAEHAAALTRQLLAFSRKQVTQPIVLDLGQTIHEIEGMLRRLIPENVVLEIGIVTDLGAIRADPMQIGQILVNLVINAVDAMPSGGRIRVYARNAESNLEPGPAPPAPLSGPHIVLDVEDTGSGMDATTLERIFDPFFTTKPQGKGTGMGLSTVHGIVLQSNAELAVTSVPGQGTVFRIFFPVVAEAPSGARPPASGPVLGGSETLLLCEDEPSVRKLTVEFLRSAGYSVLAASSGEQALALAAARPDIALLVTDVVMPGMNGVELARTLRKRLPSVQVLYLSGYTADVIDARADLGSQDLLLEKPFTREALLERVRALLDALLQQKKSDGTSGKVP